MRTSLDPLNQRLNDETFRHITQDAAKMLPGVFCVLAALAVLRWRSRKNFRPCLPVARQTLYNNKIYKHTGW